MFNIRLVFLFCDVVLSWKSKYQVFVALCNIESEYVVIALIAKKGLWIKTIIEELRHPQAHGNEDIL